MAGPAPTTLSNQEGRSAGPVHCSVWLAGPRDEQGSNPLTCRRLTHLFTSPVLRDRACAAFQQQPDDVCLLLACVLRTAPWAPSGLNGQVQGRRAGLVW